MIVAGTLPTVLYIDVNVILLNQLSLA